MSVAAWRRVASVHLLAVLVFPVLAQQRHDPLNNKEIDELRDANMDAEQRLKLFVAFARARLASLEQARSNPKTTGRGQVTHDGLTDFLDIYDELNDNVDMYVDRKDAFLLKGLTVVIEADTEFQSRLRALKDSTTASKDEAQQYEFVLTTALETVDSSLEDHRRLQKKLAEEAKAKKKTKQ